MYCCSIPAEENKSIMLTLFEETFLMVQSYLATMMILKPVILLGRVNMFVPGKPTLYH